MSDVNITIQLARERNDDNPAAALTTSAGLP